MDGEEKKFKNALEVTAYLYGAGWKATRSSTYRHLQEGKLRTDRAGEFTEKAVLKYARLFLKHLDGTTPRRGERAQQDRTEAEGRKLAAQARHWEMKAAILEGSYVLRSEFKHALAQRATLFKNDLMYFCHASAADFIHMVDGDISKTGDLIEAMQSRMDELLGRYDSEEGVTPLPLQDFGIEAAEIKKSGISQSDDEDEELEEN